MKRFAIISLATLLGASAFAERKVPVLLSWSHADTNIAFRIYWRTLPDGAWSSATTSTGAVSAIVGLSQKATNEVHVAAIGPNGDSPHASTTLVIGSVFNAAKASTATVGSITGP